MWVFTSFGVLMPSVRPKGTVPADDNRLIQVRARRMRDLVILKNEYLRELGDIIEIPYSDYEYRAYCTHEQWASALALMSMDIDYTKFKPTTEDKYGDKQLHDLYNKIWGVFFNTVSTPRHQERYLFGPQGRKKSKRRGWTGTVSRTSVESRQNWWDDANDTGAQGPLLRDLVDKNLGITTDDIQRFGGRSFSGDPEIDQVLADWDTQPGNKVPVTRRPNGTIDHSHCAHANSKNARRRCRNQANKG